MGLQDLKTALKDKKLSPRETEAAMLAFKGKSNAEIAKEMGLVITTVKYYFSWIYKKVGVKNRSQLIVWCIPHAGHAHEEVNNGTSDQ